jgi:sortase A
MRRLSLILIITGVLVLLYPLLDRAYTWYWQQKIFTGWEAERFQESRDVYHAGRKTGRSTASEEGNENPDAGTPADDFSRFDTMGILEIEKIDLKLPILKGTSESVLRIGAGFLEGTARIGEPGNTVLTAHRSHTYGRFFNRLDELEVGDSITIATTDELFSYTVYNTEIVDAKDTSILGAVGEDRILTLYTCDPLYSVNPKHRLIVQAKMEE